MCELTLDDIDAAIDKIRELGDQMVVKEIRINPNEWGKATDAMKVLSRNANVSTNVCFWYSSCYCSRVARRCSNFSIQQRRLRQRGLPVRGSGNTT